MFTKTFVAFMLIAHMMTASPMTSIYHGVDKYNSDSKVSVTKMNNDEYLLIERLSEEELNNTIVGEFYDMTISATCNARAAVNAVVNLM